MLVRSPQAVEAQTPSTSSPSAALNHNTWQVYLLRCADGTFYTGITTCLTRRLAEHNAPLSKTRHKGAKYTRARQPVALVWHESASDRAAASRREYIVRTLSRMQKEVLAAPTP